MSLVLRPLRGVLAFSGRLIDLVLVYSGSLESAGFSSRVIRCRFNAGFLRDLALAAGFRSSRHSNL